MLGQIVQDAAHQFAFDRRSIRAFLERQGFEVLTVAGARSWSGNAVRRYEGSGFVTRVIAGTVVPALDAIGRLIGRPGRMIVVARLR
jgi:hypothetical protein